MLVVQECHITVVTSRRRSDSRPLASGSVSSRPRRRRPVEERERAFSASTREVVLNGQFTVAWPKARPGIYCDRYEIVVVTKLGGDRCRFDARTTYGNTDVTLSVVVSILWAGDVPMIRTVDVEFLGLGEKFGATIVFDCYGGA